MTDWKLPMEGGCRCGAVRFRVAALPMLTMACHCRGCQQMSASAYSLSVAVPSAGFAVIQGTPVQGGLKGEQIRHQHCDSCKSWLFTRFEPDIGFVNVRATALDDGTWFTPFIETWTDEALPWARTPARHRFPGFPDPSAYGPLLAEFAQQSVRP
jgi:hypothetical protein